jgi:NAD+ synthase (glutamine-hydrolysing)
MVLTGYPIEDLALRASFVEASTMALTDLARRLDDDGLGSLPVVLGCLDRVEGAVDSPGVPKGSPQDAVAVLHRGQVVVRRPSTTCGTTGSGDEIRYFVPGSTLNLVRVAGVDVALAVCEDIWRDGPSSAAPPPAPGCCWWSTGSPYERDKDDTRLDLCRRRAAEAGCPLAWVNLVGGQDELVFDGDSMVVDRDGTLLGRGEPFVEQLLTVDLDLRAAGDAPLPEQAGSLRLVRTGLSVEPVAPYPATPVASAVRPDDMGEVWQAIVLGLRDYVRKNGFSSVLLGMSGGIDSTVVAQLACDAVGPER